MDKGNRAIRRFAGVSSGEISDQEIDDETFVGVDRRPPVTVVKNLTLELFKYLFNTGIQFQWA